MNVLTRAPTAPLPVEKVILDKNGLAYFEHIGRVSGNQGLGIEFTTAQLKDVLKSLASCPQWRKKDS